MFANSPPNHRAESARPAFRALCLWAYTACVNCGLVYSDRQELEECESESFVVRFLWQEEGGSLILEITSFFPSRDLLLCHTYGKLAASVLGRGVRGFSLHRCLEKEAPSVKPQHGAM